MAHNPEIESTIAPALDPGERPCDVLSAPPAGKPGVMPNDQKGYVEIWWEYQADRPPHKFSRPIRAF